MNGTVSKTVDSFSGSVGSNPTPSANGNDYLLRIELVQRGAESPPLHVYLTTTIRALRDSPPEVSLTE